jgi:hypothetical protein
MRSRRNSLPAECTAWLSLRRRPAPRTSSSERDEVLTGRIHIQSRGHSAADHPSTMRAQPVARSLQGMYNPRSKEAPASCGASSISAGIGVNHEFGSVGIPNLDLHRANRSAQRFRANEGDEQFRRVPVQGVSESPLHLLVAVHQATSSPRKVGVVDDGVQTMLLPQTHNCPIC